MSCGEYWMYRGGDDVRSYYNPCFLDLIKGEKRYKETKERE
jgi:hypothetical protein